MTKFKCKISDLETIMRLVESKGKNIDGKEYQAITDCLLTASEGKLSVKAMDTMHTFAMKVDYKNINVIESGDLPIGDLTNFSAILSRFEPLDDVTVYINENKIFIDRESPKKIAKIPMVSPETVASMPVPPLDKLTFSDAGYPSKLNLKLVIDSEKISSIFADGDVVKERILPWKIEDSKLKVSIGSETFGSFETELVADEMHLDGIQEVPTPMKTQTAFGNGLDNIFSNLNGKVSIYLTNAVEISPLCITQETEKFSYLALLAPYAMRD